MGTEAASLGSRMYSPPEVMRIWGIYGDLIIIYPKPYSIYLRGTIGLAIFDLELRAEA